MVPVDMALEGFLLCDKPVGKTSFSLVHFVRRSSGQKIVGHAGTLDPFASGLLILLLGRTWTRQVNMFMGAEKVYEVVATLGVSTDTFDVEGTVCETSVYVPSRAHVEEVLSQFQGKIAQVPPMFSAKKIQGKKLYTLARQGIEVARAPVFIDVQIEMLFYEYPHLCLSVTCSKGTYIRSLVHDIGKMLGCFAHATSLRRLKIGSYDVADAITCPAWNDVSKESLVSYLRFDL